jgi:acyl carrier protein
MGLDSIEIVIRAEKLFGIEIGDDDAGKIRTVGEFYPLICSKLRVSPLPSPITSEKLP